MKINNIKIWTTFIFLFRSWRNGEDADLCTGILKETLDALRALPIAAVFDETIISPIWLEAVEKSEKFLHSVANGLVHLFFCIKKIVVVSFKNNSLF